MAESPELHLARRLAVPYAPAEAVLRAGPRAWLPGFAQRGERITARLAWGQVTRRVAVQVGTVQRFAYGVSVRLEWQDARRAALYPRLEGHLRLERAGEESCRLRLDARYDPPAGGLGESMDRALLHRVSGATVGDFLDTVAERLRDDGAIP